MNISRGYLVIPKLIEQPTWGGTYIAKYKGWGNAPWAVKKIGQAYELYEESNLSLVVDSSDSSFGPELDTVPPGAISIQSLLSIDARAVLGDHASKVFNGYLKTLIKFTQAKGNSFQLHVKPGTPNTKWKPKPESWYYFEPGLATLGLKNPSELNAYKKACIDIEGYMKSLSLSVQDGSLTIRDAKARALVFIKERNIYQYVHVVNVPKDSIVDLSACGIHHSWEEDDEKIPNGNIVYEVQVDVDDSVSSIRSFDKGKIADDGTVRPVHVEDYFKYIDSSEQRNDPSQFMKIPDKLDEGDNHVSQKVFSNKAYSMHRLLIRNSVFNAHTDTGNVSFHHLFVQEGQVEYKDDLVDIQVGRGHSVFIPAKVGKYTLTSISEHAIVLKTFV